MADLHAEKRSDQPKAAVGRVLARWLWPHIRRELLRQEARNAQRLVNAGLLRDRSQEHPRG